MQGHGVVKSNYFFNTLIAPVLTVAGSALTFVNNAQYNYWNTFLQEKTISFVHSNSH